MVFTGKLNLSSNHSFNGFLHKSSPKRFNKALWKFSSLISNIGDFSLNGLPPGLSS